MNERTEGEIALCAQLAQSALEVTTSMFPKDPVLTAATGKIGENRYWGFTHLARGLFKYDPQIQDNFWVAYCQKIGMPNAEKVGSFAASISSTRWLFPTGKLGVKELQSSINEHLSGLNLQTIPTKLIRFTQPYDTQDVAHGIELPLQWWNLYNDKLKTVAKAVEEIAKMTGRSDALLTAQEIVDNIAEELMLSYQHPDALVPNYLISKVKIHFLNAAVRWMVIEDQDELINAKGYSNKNPFLPAVELCRAGYVLFGPRRNEDTTEEYIILDPTVKSIQKSEENTVGTIPDSTKKEAGKKFDRKPSVGKRIKNKEKTDDVDEIQLARSLVEKLRSLAAMEHARASLFEETAEGLEVLIEKLNQGRQQ